LLDLGCERDDLGMVLRRFRDRRDLFRPENVALIGQVEELSARYSALTGSMTAHWDGRDVPLSLLRPLLRNPDRVVRERAYRLQIAPYVTARDLFAAIFDEQFALRQRIARNAGLANYRDYAFRDFNRFDYGPLDCETFHEAVASTVVPALARRYERRRRQLGLATLRTWDLDVDPLGRPALRPYETAEDLVRGAHAAFDRLDPTLAGYFATMAREGLLDLDSRPGKEPVGYCLGLAHRRRAFILMNGAGLADDVTTLLHEAGHAFHSFEAFTLPLVFQRNPGEEMGEVASMAMELLAAPYLGADGAGFYDAEGGRRQRVEHLESILDVLALVAIGDAFQHWLYASDQGDDRDARDAAWVEISGRYGPWLDWDGLAAERVARWYQQSHFFLFPFYFIEYGLAQVGALQIWRHSKRDEAEAVAAYRRALALGGTRPLPDLYAAAGARFAVDAGMLGELVSLIEQELSELDR
jgi:oligoendopeptidase F